MNATLALIWRWQLLDVDWSDFAGFWPAEASPKHAWNLWLTVMWLDSLCQPCEPLEEPQLLRKSLTRQSVMHGGAPKVGRNWKGQTKWDKRVSAKFCSFLQFPAVSCESLWFPAVFCENLRLPNAVIPRKSEDLQESAKICETKKLWIWLRLSHLVCLF